MAESGNARRVCLLAEIDRFGEFQPVAQSSLARRLDNAIKAAVETAGADLGETWRRDRGARQLVLLPVAADPATVVPLLARGLLAGLDRSRAAADEPTLRIRVAIARDSVIQVKGSYVGRAVVTATRLLDSGVMRAELSGDPAALLALIISDAAYQDVLARSGPKFPLAGFRPVKVEMPEQGWQAAGWIRACQPGSLGQPPGWFTERRGDVLPALAAGAGDAANVLETATNTTGGTGHDELETATGHLMASHESADHATSGTHASTTAHVTGDHGSYAESSHDSAGEAYVADVTHTYTVENGGYAQEYQTHSVYDGAAYDDHDHQSSADHQDGVV